jgi:hypothetical protein
MRIGIGLALVGIVASLLAMGCDEPDEEITGPTCESTEVAAAAPDFRNDQNQIRVYADAVFGQLYYDPFLPFAASVGDWGACRLTLREDEPICESCFWDEGICLDDGVCVPLPRGAHAGDLTVTSPSGTFTIEGDQGNYSLYGPPVAAPCEQVSIEAPGSTFAGFSAQVQMVPPLVIHDLEGWETRRLTAEEDLEIRWQPADPGSRIRLTMRTDWHHGIFYSPVLIECDAPDSAGSLLVPREFLAPYVDESNWEGCGSCARPYLVRYRRTAIETSTGTVSIQTLTTEVLPHFPFPADS